MKDVYLVLSQTGTIVSRLIKLFTHEPYSHASVSLDRHLKTLYSFGRTQLYNALSGGFCKESPDYGTFKRFKRTKVAVLRLHVTESVYEELSELLERMYAERKKYRYNYRGLFLAAKGKACKRENCYYCSEFVRELFVRFGLTDKDFFGDAVRPTELLNLPNAELVYEGRMSHFAYRTHKKCKICVAEFKSSAAQGKTIRRLT